MTTDRAGERPKSSICIAPARSEADLSQVRGLFREYAESLGFSLCFQGFDAEMAALPGCYAAPRGEILLAWSGDAAVGCVAVRPIDGELCEMKRMFLRPAARGSGVGRRLGEEIVRIAREIGYRGMRLDTLTSMTAARRLYASLGFVEIPPYYENPIAGAVYMELKLGRG